MRDAAVIRRNERLRAFTGQLYNLGAALFGGAMVRMYADGGPGAETGVWAFGAVLLISVGHGLLGLIEDDEL